MKTGKVSLIDSKYNRIEVQGGTTSAVAISVVTLIAILGALKFYELNKEFRIELERIRKSQPD